MLALISLFWSNVSLLEIEKKIDAKTLATINKSAKTLATTIKLIFFAFFTKNIICHYQKYIMNVESLLNFWKIKFQKKFLFLETL